jgi:hypothetical protein
MVTDRSVCAIQKYAAGRASERKIAPGATPRFSGATAKAVTMAGHTYAGP